MKIAEAIVQAIAFFGVFLLIFPAFHAAKYARLATKLERARPKPGVPGRDAFKEAYAGLVSVRDNWTRWKSFCLYLGTGLTVLGAAGAAGLAIWRLVPGQ